MTEFVIDFNESLAGLARFQTGMTALGKALDTAEGKTNKTVAGAGKLFEKMEKEFSRLEKALTAAGQDGEALGNIMNRVRADSAKLMSGIAAANLKATVAAQAYNGQLTEMRRLMDDTAKKNGFVQTQQQISQMANKLANENTILSQRINALTTAEGRLNEALKAELSYRKALATENQKASQTSQSLQRQLERLNSEQAQSDAILRALIAARKAEYAENTKLDAILRTLERTYSGLNGGLQQQIAEMQALVQARKNEITETIREDAKIKELQRTLASLTNGRQQEITKLNAQIAARKKAITEGLTEKRVVSEQQKALEKERETLARLQAQMTLMSSARGQQITRIKEQIKEQEALNRVHSASMATLLGASTSQQRLNLSQQVGSQSAAMLRAGLTGLHASVGMYTSATVLAATATYGIASALRNSVITGAEFEATMSRTEAIMSSGGPQWLDRTAQTQALNKEVRALGQSTVFTASEVADGLQQIGMAGISAADAMTALPATLTLANLANVSMARSADIATNVLMTFNMEAKDLGKVVDLMATAVNNSNTDIEQLANALTYAGPAAQTAGISLQETTAAIETLANSGIKASRSGSALRRLFVSLLNPTKKGRQVLDQYGISVLDAEGKTRSLVDIVGQLNSALKGLDGADRLSAIQNLVGVYATSPVAALVDNSDRFATFAEQNQNVSGAGERMEKIISDNLKFDWKALLSALEEVQLQAFDSMGMRLRDLVAGMTVDVLKILEPVKTIIGSDGAEISVTGLDEMLVKAENLGKSLAYAAAGFVAFKGLNGGVFNAFTSDLTKVNRNMTEVRRRADIMSSGFLLVGSNANGARTGVDAMNVAMGRTTQMAGLAASGVGLLAKGVGMLSTALGVLSRVAGWAGLIYGVYQAIDMAFGQNTDEQILAHKESVDEVESSYDKLKRTLEDMANVKQQQALNGIIDSNIKGMVDVSTRKVQNQVLIDKARATGVPEEYLAPLLAEQTSLNASKQEYAAKIVESQKALKDLGTTTKNYDDDLETHRANLQEIINLTNDLTLARARAVKSAEAGDSFKGLALADAQRVGVLEQNLLLAKGRTQRSMVKVNDTARNIPTVEAKLNEVAEQNAAKAAEEHYKKVTPAAQQLLDKEKEITKEKAYQAGLMAQDLSARQLVDANRMRQALPGDDKVMDSAKRLAALEADRLVLQEKVQEQTTSLEETRSNSAEAEMTDTQRLLSLKTRLTDVNAQIAAAENPGEGKAKDLEKLNDLYRRQLQYRQGIKSIEGKESKAGQRGQSADARELEQAQRAYDTLAKKLDAVTYSQRELDKGTKAMTLLRANNRITVEQEAKAIGELNQQHYEAVRAQNLLLGALDKTRSSLTSSPYASLATDLSTLNRALDAGMIKMEEHARLTANLYEQRRKSIADSLPKASMTLGDAGSTPFTDMMSSVMTGIEDQKSFSNAKRDVSLDRDNQMETLNAQFKTRLELLQSQKLIEQGQEEAHVQKMLEINADYANQKTALTDLAARDQQTIIAKQAEYEKQSADMLKISMLSSFGDILGMFAATGEDATAAQKAAFVAQKAIAVAQIIMYTEMAAMQAMAAPDVPLFSMKIPAAMAIRAIGYASAGLTAGLAIGQLSSGSSSGSTQMYDTGGYIPYNRTGIVGEYGPELVSGPTHVRGRGSSSSTMGGGGVTEQTITLAPVIQVQMPEGTGTGSDGRQEAAQVANVVTQVVMKQMRDAIKPNGMLDTWMRNSRRG